MYGRNREVDIAEPPPMDIDSRRLRRAIEAEQAGKPAEPPTAS